MVSSALPIFLSASLLEGFTCRQVTLAWLLTYWPLTEESRHKGSLSSAADQFLLGRHHLDNSASRSAVQGSMCSHLSLHLPDYSHKTETTGKR